MNSFMCRLTGGHKYADCNLKTERIPDDTRKLCIYNRCVKCGNIYVAVIDIDRIFQADKKRGENNA